MFFAVSPENPHDRAIVDLGLAPRNAAGGGRVLGGLFIVKPKDPARSSGTLLLQVYNRGGKGILVSSLGSISSRFGGNRLNGVESATSTLAGSVL